MLTRISCLTKDAAPKKGGAGRFSFLILPDFLGSVEKHFPPATRLPGFGPCDLGSILPSRLPLEITTCGYVQATLLHLRCLADLERRESGNSWQFLRSPGPEGCKIGFCHHHLFSFQRFAVSRDQWLGISANGWELKPRGNYQIPMISASDSHLIHTSSGKKGERKNGTDTHHLCAPAQVLGALPSFSLHPSLLWISIVPVDEERASDKWSHLPGEGESQNWNEVWHLFIHLLTLVQDLKFLMMMANDDSRNWSLR